MNAKKRREALFTVVATCGHPQCPARETVINVKDYEGTFAATVARQGLACPVCWSPLTLTDVIPASQERPVRRAQ